MRLKVTFYTKDDENYEFNKYDIQGMIYSALLDAGMTEIHAGNKIRFFCFSDIFPSNILKKDFLFNFIISSPDSNIIKNIYNILDKNKIFYLSGYKFHIAEIKEFDINISKDFITGSPVVLYLDNKKNKYFSIKDDSIAFFLRRLKENAIKKFNLYYHENININHLIFDKLKFHREVALLLRKGKTSFNIIGTTWYNLHLNKLNRDEIKFYNFIMDAGIGEKNSLGFGFLNPVRNYGQ